MQILTDDELKAERRKHNLALFVGVGSFLAGGAIIASNAGSGWHWLAGALVVVAGAIAEEKYILRRK